MESVVNHNRLRLEERETFLYSKLCRIEQKKSMLFTYNQEKDAMDSHDHLRPKGRETGLNSKLLGRKLNPPDYLS